LFSCKRSVFNNDIVDLESDKTHPIKRLRPLASGKITASQGKILTFILISTAILFSFLLDKNICWVVIAYITLNCLYTKVLKNAVIIDEFCVGAFFYLRLLVGSLSSGVALSNWIILCATLLA
jgi:4-hydroxybenzoate polyprenyltransferase